MKIDPNSPAFPHGNQELGASHRIAQPGMTVRAWLAGKAMEGLLASDTNCMWTTDKAVNAAVAHADALIARLNEGEQP